MKYCEQCKVSVTGQRSRCPLCQSVLRDEGEPYEEVFPVIPTVYNRFQFFFKLLIFASIFELDEERAAFYRTRIAGGDRTILWLYAAGVSDGKTIDPARNRAYTGAEFGAPGCVRTDHGNYKTCYLHDPEKLDDVLIREIAREAGVRLWTEESAPVFANDRLAAFHTATGGERKLTFPETIESVTELYSGKHFTLKDHTLLYRFETPDTALFELCTHNPKETIS